MNKTDKKKGAEDRKQARIVANKSKGPEGGQTGSQSANASHIGNKSPAQREKPGGANNK